MHGILLVDKPSGPTSFEVVRAVRRAAGQRKVGHSGTLDPLASGLLVVGLGEGTKLTPYLMSSEKRYRALVVLGAATDTDDRLGREIARAPVPALTRDHVEQALAGFVGEVRQVPPAYSALKRDGEALHRKARRGEQVRPEPRLVTIRAIDVLALERTSIELDVRCGKGTYIRSLARDLGEALGTRAHLAELRRLSSAGFSVERAVTLDDLCRCDFPGEIAPRVLSMADALPGLPAVILDDGLRRRVGHGQRLSIEDIADPPCREGLVRMIGPAGELVAVASLADGVARPLRVFNH
ncbi:MAG: tRNA pseudouridine(55) synthase TruB [Deltaproteobacteria bacterium]|jgi:tRNA pseudouridine55 synthase|nr:tRNA pseudouridine(55) synthase TruB [Deltaproteobacteria bacterium]